MTISRRFKALTALLCSITIFGVNVVLLDDYATGSDTPTTVQMAPVTSPVIENISTTANTDQNQYQQQNLQPIVAGQPTQIQANQGVN